MPCKNGLSQGGEGAELNREVAGEVRAMPSLRADFSRSWGLAGGKGEEKCN